MTEQAKVYKMDGVPEWMSRIAESGQISVASLMGKIFATDGHVCVLAFDAPDGLSPLTEATRPKLSGVSNVLKEPDGASSYTIPLLDLKTWCGPVGPTISCSHCCDEGATECDICEASGILSMDCKVAGCREDHTDDCCVCGGSGYQNCEECEAVFTKRRDGNLQGVLVNMALIWSFTAHLEGPTVRVVVEGPEKPLRFYGDDWKAVVMPLRARPEELPTAKELKLQ